MRTIRIYTEQELAAGAVCELEAGPSQHLSKVLRRRVGDSLVVFNGQGGEYLAEIAAIAKQTVSVKALELRPNDGEPTLPIHLGIALSRGERMDWVMQKSTELGVHSITPLHTERTEVKLTQDRAAKKQRHWRQITISASEQCGRDQLPALGPTMALSQWLEEAQAEAKLVLHHRAEPLSLPESPASVALLIGPEGGLSAQEIVQIEKAGFQSLALGPRVMRTETAPVAALAILQSRWGDMAI